MNHEELKEAVSSLKPLTVKFKKDLKESLSNLYPDYDTKEAACLFYLDLTEPPKCRVCGNRTPFYPLARATIKANIGGWNDVCSHACSGIKNKETSMEKYGATHHLKKESTSNSMQKQADTNIEKYGKAHVLQVKSINDKMQEDIRERNNGFHFMQKESGSGVQEKIQATNRENHGKNSYFQTEEFKEISRASNLASHGYEYPSQNPEIRKKAVNTWMQNHGVDNPWKSRAVINSMAIARFEKEAKTNPNEIARRFYQNAIDHGDVIALAFELDQMIESGVENSLIGVTTYTGIPLSHINNILIKNPNLRDKINFDTRWSSFPERDLVLIFENLGIKTIKNDRKLVYPKEIDCYFPDQKVAIEINGVYYHSEYRGGKDSKYHVSKTDLCNTQGIKLFHFTDVQLELKKPIIVSMIKNALGITEKKIFARKTDLKILTGKDCIGFFNENHIDGNAESDFAIGLYLEDEMVMCMSIDRPRLGHATDHEFEIVRLASKLNTNVIGGFEKIWNHFIQEYDPPTVMSYQDRRYGGFESKAYSSVMKMIRKSDPAWEGINIKTGEIKHRLWFTTNRLKEMFPESYDEQLTIKENMINHGYDRIWNCGQYVWSYTKK